MAPLLFFESIGDGEAARVGGKAATLARLKRLGFPVPDGFVVLAETRLDEGMIGEALARLGGEVAVRSSSTAEDLQEASFAGQYRSILGVSGAAAVIEAVRACRASGGDAAAYALEMGTAAGKMAVLVQRMVEPAAAGVAFGRDPRNPRHVLVEATRGRGDRLLAGETIPDGYALDRDTGALVEGPADGVLDEASLASTVRLLRRVEEAQGGPQDIEWALGDAARPDEIALLQARPITAPAEAPSDPRLHRLTRANVGEVLPGPVTPLTFTTVGAFLEHAFRSVVGDAGLLPPNAPPVVVLHRQRLYLNLSLVLDLSRRLPGLTAEDAERLILGSGSTQGAATPRLSFAALGVAGRLLRLGAKRPAAVLAAERLVQGLRDEGVPKDLSAEALATRLEHWATVGRRMATTHVLASGASATALAFLTRALQAFATGDAAERVSRLTGGLNDVESAAPTLALEEMARRVASQPEWLAFLERGSFSTGDPLSAAPEDFRRDFEGFLLRYGHRALSEGELAAPSWADDPTPVLNSLLSLVKSPEAGAALARRSRAELRHTEEQTLGHRFGFLDAVFESLLRRAQAGVREREHTKSLTVAVADHGRRLVRDAGGQLKAAGRIANLDDVFFLEFGELLSALRGGRLETATPARRKRRFAREGALPAPREVDLRASSAPGESSSVESDGVLRGIGVSSGVGRGPARILRPGEAPSLAPGDVLVAPVLDAALGPLLATAAGAVAEMGGVLSHGSVVARELGVPCVVDVRGATTALRDGEIVLVDGGTGEVRRTTPSASALEGGAPAPPPLLDAEDDESERFVVAKGAPARQSVYFTFADEATGLRLIATLGVRRGGRGESVIALSLPEGDVLFALDLARAEVGPSSLRVTSLETTLGPVRLRGRTRLGRHEARGFPPSPLPLLLLPRTVEVELDLVFEPASPTLDFCRTLADGERAAVSPMGDHHLEQAGTFKGRIRIDDRAHEVAGHGTRDHSWGERQWNTLDHSRLFMARFGDAIALHALTLGVNGRIVEGGFLWRNGRAERITRVLYGTERRNERLVGVDVEVRTSEGAVFRMAGRVERSLDIPVQVERRPLRHLQGRPYALLLRENFVRWTADGRTGLGVAELSERPR